MTKIRNRDWVEPAHPMLVQRFDDFIDIYRFLKDATPSSTASPSRSASW